MPLRSIISAAEQCANGTCNHLCNQTPKGAVCSCRTGYELLRDRVCVGELYQFFTINFYNKLSGLQSHYSFIISMKKIGLLFQISTNARPTEFAIRSAKISRARTTVAANRTTCCRTTDGAVRPKV